MVSNGRNRSSRALTVIKKTYTDEKGEILPEEKDRFLAGHCHHPEPGLDAILNSENKSVEDAEPCTQK